MSNSLANELKRSKYRLLGLVGQGQFGRVYCASHRRTGHLYALKELNKDRFPTHKFLRELRFLLSLRHPNIVTCHALEHTSYGRYLVMDYCEGGTLRELMEKDGQVHPAQSLKLIMDVLEGLAHAHSRDIIHCDIKPENILLSLHPQGWTARISDFGIARLSQEMLSDSSGNTGSPAYMAPERFYGQYSYSSDLYAVGILLFELLAGERPFSGTPADLMSAHLNQPVQIPDRIPDPLRSILLIALQKLQARRFRSAKEMLDALRSAIMSLPVFGIQPGAALLQLQSEVRVTPFVSQHQEALPKAVHHLTIAGSTHLYRAFGNRVGCQTYADPILAANPTEDEDPVPLTAVRLPEPIRQLVLPRSRCLAIGQRAIYQIPTSLFEPGVTQHGQKHLQVSREFAPEQDVPQLLAEFDSDFLATVEPEGHWLATASPALTEAPKMLSFWQLQRWKDSSPTPGSHDSMRGSPQTRVVYSAGRLFQLLALDKRYIAGFFHRTDRQTDTHIVQAHLEVFTRRGYPFGSITLPVPLRSVVATTKPYRLLAIEPEYPNALLMLDLKPLRMQRVCLGMVPVALAAASWGAVFVDQAGQIVLTNPYGQVEARIAGPANPTAIAVVEPHGLAIATWHNGEGLLHLVDLKQLDLDILF